MLRKNQERFSNFNEVLDQDHCVNGPVHDLARYAKFMGIGYRIDNGAIIMIFPGNTGIDICITHLTHLRACLRDACRRALMRKLSERVHGRIPKLRRKDMEGIVPDVDVAASTALMHSTGEMQDIKEGANFLDWGAKGKLMLPINMPCKTNDTTRRRQQTIVAGSIRPPHLRKYALESKKKRYM